MEFGKTEVMTYFVSLIALVALYTDFRDRKIYNWLTLPSLALGLIYSLWAGGWSGLGWAFLSVLLVFVLFGGLFFFGMMGAGDVKLLMALAAWGGWHFGLELMILSILIGGVLSIAVLIFKGQALDFGIRFYHFLLSYAVSGPRKKFEVNPHNKMPFGIPISLAAIWLVWDQPFERLGVKLWR